MKIGLLSFHNALNYGAALQAYALERVLEDHGYDCEYIDYQNIRRRQGYDMLYLIRDSFCKGKLKDALKYTLGYPFLSLRKFYFSEFYKSHVKYSGNTYYNKEDIKKLSDTYDMYIVGSDQVWNPDNNGSDTTFLLDFVADKTKTISYSSSFGVIDIPDCLKTEYSTCLKSISHLATREVSGVALIKKLTGRDAKLVLDPVFLLPRNSWLELIGHSNDLKKNIIFSYTNQKGQFEEFLKTTGYDTARMTHYKLSRFTTLNDFINPQVRIKYFMPPFEFLRVISSSDLVVSASFHCLSFCIIFNVPFLCFLTGDEGKDERIVTLLSHFGLSERIFSTKMTLADVNRTIDWENVNKKLDGMRSDSINYLINNLKDGPK